MKNNHFNAILAKNAIARELKVSKNLHENINICYVIGKLQEIEKFTGEGNQPSIESILTSELDI